MTTSEIAEKLGKNRVTIWRHATKLGLAGLPDLTQAQAAAIAASILAARPGNPNLIRNKDLLRTRR